jgi:hypothetical protein
MVFKTFFVALCGTTVIFVHAAAGSRLGHQHKADLLAAQNKYRTELGEAPLIWSDKLEANAQAWAEHLANKVHAIVHSGATASGENLAAGTAGHTSLANLVNLWGAEKQHFVDGSFPHVSRTGDWKAVGHYTQIIWRKTKEVGCGMATGGGQDYLVCQYHPRGNVMGQRVY